MEYALWAMAIFGFVAFCSIGTLTSRIRKLEQQMANLEGSPAHEEKLSLMKVMRDYVGKKVELEFKGEQMDMDLTNAKFRKGSCIIEDADKDWVRVHVTYDKTDKVKLIRLQEISGVKGMGE
ncbi:MAG: hypothetical protein II139_06980 [Lachnospiraceae bacterium]|nr:hypothetical protein [Lachnospiraceae bacterium]